MYSAHKPKYSVDLKIQNLLRNHPNGLTKWAIRYRMISQWGHLSPIFYRLRVLSKNGKIWYDTSKGRWKAKELTTEELRSSILEALQEPGTTYEVFMRVHQKHYKGLVPDQSLLLRIDSLMGPLSMEGATHWHKSKWRLPQNEERR